MKPIKAIFMKLTHILCLLWFTCPLMAQETEPGIDSIVVIASKYLKDTKYEEAKNLFKLAAQQYKANGDWEQYLYCLNKVGGSYFRLKNYEEASQTARMVLQLNENPDKTFPLETARSWYLLGRIAHEKEQYEIAKTNHQKALYIRQKHLDPGHIDIGWSLFQTAKVFGPGYLNADSSIYYYQKAQHIFESIPAEKNTLAKMTVEVGFVFENLKRQLDAALQHYEEAIALYSKDPVDTMGLASTYNYCSNIYLDKGSITQSENYIQKGLLLLENQPLSKAGLFLQRMYKSLGVIYYFKGDSPTALEQVEKGYAIALQVLGEDKFETKSYYNYLGMLNAETGNFDKSLLFFRKFLNEIEKNPNNHFQASQVIANIAYLFLEMGDYTQAIKYYKQSLSRFLKTGEQFNPYLARAYNDIGSVYLEQRDYQNVIAYAQKSIAANRSEIKDPSTSQVTTFWLNRNSLLVSYSMKANALFQLGQINEDKDYFEKALRAYLRSDSLVNEIYHEHTEEQDQFAFSNTAHGLFKGAIETCYALYQISNDRKYIDQAFYFSERSKANTLLKNLKGTTALRFANLPDSVLLHIDHSQKDISDLQRQLQQARQQQDSLKSRSAQVRLADAKAAYRKQLRKLEQQYPAYYQLKYDRQLATMEQIQNELKQQQTNLVSYFIADSSVFIFTATPDHYWFDNISLTNSWHDHIRRFRKSISNVRYLRDSIHHAYPGFVENGHALYQQFLQPAMDHLQGTSLRRIKIIPDGELGYIPFEILLKQIPSDDHANYASLIPFYVIQDFEYSYAYSGTMMLFDQQPIHLSTRYNYAGFAPEYGSQIRARLDSLEKVYAMRYDEEDLPAARKAVSAIAEMINGTSFLSEAASEATFKQKAARYNVLHLAMHGVLDDQNPLYSKLVFASGKGSLEDNYLNAYELYNMQLPAQLAVLSACNTGMGTLQKGEGVMSLSRAFAYAGVPSIIMSLWSVPDEETGELMTSFFKGLKEGLPKDEALRNAKLAYLNDDSVLPERLHPLFWAGFVQIGDAGPVTFQSQTFPWEWIFGGLIAMSIGWGIWKRRG